MNQLLYYFNYFLSWQCEFFYLIHDFFPFPHPLIYMYISQADRNFRLTQ